MSDTFYIKQNDTSPAIKYQLDPVVDLTGAGIIFNMTASAGGIIIARSAANIVGDPTSGIVSYEWVANDTTKTGNFRGEFEVTYSDGRIETFPNKGYIQIYITGDLG